MLLVLVAVGCHAPAPAPAPEAPPERPQPPAPVQLPVEPIEPTTDQETTDKPTVAVLERKAPDGIPPPGVDAAQTACEQSCGDVHDCALIDSTYTPTAAAAIELGCLRACVEAPEQTTSQTSLFGCPRPPAIEPVACDSFIGCLGPVWPDVQAPPFIEPDTCQPDVGCARGCEALGRCVPDTKPEDIAECFTRCERSLTPEWKCVLSECVELQDCALIEQCISDIPGA